jgi:glycerophosphoryl diester phosphodiesterase
MSFLRGDWPLLRIGHRGAAALAPPNTIAGIEAALAHGVDMVELDVVARPDGELVLGHSLREIQAEHALFEDALELLRARPEVGLLADVKRPGYERILVEALRRHALLERTIASSSELHTLLALRRAEPMLARGRTYPRDRLHVGQRRTFVPLVWPTLRALRAALPRRIGPLLAQASASVATLQHRVVSRAAVERCHEHGAAVFAWTVNEPALVHRLDAIGVDGVITDDPRVFPGSRATLQA